MKNFFKQLSKLSNFFDFNNDVKSKQISGKNSVNISIVNGNVTCNTNECLLEDKNLPIIDKILNLEKSFFKFLNNTTFDVKIKNSTLFYSNVIILKGTEKALDKLKISQGEILKIDADNFSSHQDVSIEIFLDKSFINSFKHIENSSVGNIQLLFDSFIEEVKISSTGSVNCCNIEGSFLNVNIDSIGDFNCKSINNNECNIYCNSNGSFKSSYLKSDFLNIHCSSIGNVNISQGQAQFVDVSVSSVGCVMLKNLVAQEATCSTSSIGNIDISCSGRFKTHSSSIGNIKNHI